MLYKNSDLSLLRRRAAGVGARLSSSRINRSPGKIISFANGSNTENVKNDAVGSSDRLR